MSREDERRFGTADFARTGEAPQTRPQEDMRGNGGMHAEPLAALFQGQAAEDFRRRWDAIQIAFVDDPRAAVQNADELVAQVLRSLAESFAQQRSEIESGLGGDGQSNTENMRVALQRYRSFFQRLLSL